MHASSSKEGQRTVRRAPMRVSEKTRSRRVKRDRAPAKGEKRDGNRGRSGEIEKHRARDGERRMRGEGEGYGERG